jgi:hypothetical protein
MLFYTTLHRLFVYTTTQINLCIFFFCILIHIVCKFCVCNFFSQLKRTGRTHPPPLPSPIHTFIYKNFLRSSVCFIYSLSFFFQISTQYSKIEKREREREGRKKLTKLEPKLHSVLIIITPPLLSFFFLLLLFFTLLCYFISCYC